MNYSSVVRGSLNPIREVLAQSELELGRPLSKAEENKLFKKFPPQNVLDKIHKVGYELGNI